jgi:predicted secreted acid phosphatase
MMKAYKSPDGCLTIVDTGHSMFVRIEKMEEGRTYHIMTKMGDSVKDFEELHEGMSVDEIFDFVDDKIPVKLK